MGKFNFTYIKMFVEVIYTVCFYFRYFAINVMCLMHKDQQRSDLVNIGKLLFEPSSACLAHNKKSEYSIISKLMLALQTHLIINQPGLDPGWLMIKCVCKVNINLEIIEYSDFFPTKNDNFILF